MHTSQSGRSPPPTVETSSTRPHREHSTPDSTSSGKSSKTPSPSSRVPSPAAWLKRGRCGAAAAHAPQTRRPSPATATASERSDRSSHVAKRPLQVPPHEERQHDGQIGPGEREQRAKQDDATVGLSPSEPALCERRSFQCALRVFSHEFGIRSPLSAWTQPFPSVSSLRAGEQYGTSP